MRPDLIAKANDTGTDVRFIGRDNVIATTETKTIDLQVLLLLLRKDIDRDWWLDIAAAAWDAANG